MSDLERDEKGLRSLFGDGAVVLPVGKHFEGYELFAILAQIGVKIFDRVYAVTQERYREGYERFMQSEISFIEGRDGYTELDGYFKVFIKIEDGYYAGNPRGEHCCYDKFLIFRLYIQHHGDFGDTDWIEIKDLELSEYKSYWEKFSRSKEALIAELSK